MTDRLATEIHPRAVDADDRGQVTEVLSRYGHIVDNEEWAQLSLVFTPDATLDAQYTTATGLDAIQRYLQSLGPWRSHHTVNTILEPAADGGAVRAWSRGLVVEAAGTSISADYVDELTRTDAGWRIRARRISLRNRAGQAPDGQPWRTETFSTWNAG